MSEHEQNEVCREIFRNIEKQLNFLVDADKERNGRYDKHVTESIEYRTKIDRCDEQLKDIKLLHREIRLWCLGLLVTIIIASLYLGDRFSSLNRLEALHPIGASIEISNYKD